MKQLRINLRVLAEQYGIAKLDDAFIEQNGREFALVLEGEPKEAK
jgi:hypothetical protein